MVFYNNSRRFIASLHQIMSSMHDRHVPKCFLTVGWSEYDCALISTLSVLFRPNIQNYGNNFNLCSYLLLYIVKNYQSQGPYKGRYFFHVGKYKTSAIFLACVIFLCVVQYNAKSFCLWMVQSPQGELIISADGVRYSSKMHF